MNTQLLYDNWLHIFAYAEDPMCILLIRKDLCIHILKLLQNELLRVFSTRPRLSVAALAHAFKNKIFENDRMLYMLDDAQLNNVMRECDASVPMLMLHGAPADVIEHCGVVWDCHDDIYSDTINVMYNRLRKLKHVRVFKIVGKFLEHVDWCDANSCADCRYDDLSDCDSCDSNLCEFHWCGDCENSEDECKCTYFGTAEWFAHINRLYNDEHEYDLDDAYNDQVYIDARRDKSADESGVIEKNYYKVAVVNGERVGVYDHIHRAADLFACDHCTASWFHEKLALAMLLLRHVKFETVRGPLEMAYANADRFELYTMECKDMSKYTEYIIEGLMPHMTHAKYVEMDGVVLKN